MIARTLTAAACGIVLMVSAARAAAPGTTAMQTATPPQTTPAQAGNAPGTPTTPPADSALEARTSAVAAQLRCPVCQGLSIQDSPAELARSMRALVRDQLAAGKTPDEVKAYFVSKYGEWILLAPKPRGFNLLAYLFPVLVVFGGGAAIFLAVRRWTTGANEDLAPQPSDATSHSAATKE